MKQWGKYFKAARLSLVILTLLALPLAGPALAQDATFITVGDEATVPGGKIMTSTNGAAWISRTSPGTQIINLWGVTRGGGLIVAVGDLGTILTSKDGITWTERASNATNSTLFAVTHHEDLFVAVGSNPTSGIGTILTSPDGITWTSRTSGTLNALFGVKGGGGLFVAVGDLGTILTSPDGVTWTNRSASAGTNPPLLFGITSGKGLFVVSGDLGTILTSPDGANWTAVTPAPTTQLLNSVDYDGESFTAVGMAGVIFTSKNGTTWTPQTSNTPGDLFSVASNRGIHVAVGLGGTVITSSDGSTWAVQTSGATFDLNSVTSGKINLFLPSVYH
jgi:hypothetical protein